MDAVISEILKLFPIFIGLILALYLQQKQIIEQRERILELETEIKRLSEMLFVRNKPVNPDDTKEFPDNYRP